MTDTEMNGAVVDPSKTISNLLFKGFWEPVPVDSQLQYSPSAQIRIGKMLNAKGEPRQWTIGMTQNGIWIVQTDLPHPNNVLIKQAWMLNPWPLTQGLVDALISRYDSKARLLTPEGNA